MPSCDFHSARVFLLLLFLGLRGEEIAKPQIKIWHIFLRFLNICTWNYFTSLAIALKMFSNCAAKHRKRDVTTVFTYSHLNTPINQWERAYYLNYFIKQNEGPFPMHLLFQCLFLSLLISFFLFFVFGH